MRWKKCVRVEVCQVSARFNDDACLEPSAIELKLQHDVQKGLSSRSITHSQPFDTKFSNSAAWRMNVSPARLALVNSASNADRVPLLQNSRMIFST